MLPKKTSGWAINEESKSVWRYCDIEHVIINIRNSLEVTGLSAEPGDRYLEGCWIVK